VRNSIILVDFIELRRKQGMALAEAVVDAGAIRFRPMLLTAAAVVAEVSILTVGPHTKLPPTVEAIRRVLCPVNYSPSSQTALDLAAALAAGTGAELIVAHIDETPLGKSVQDSLQHLCDWIPATVRAHCAVKEVVKQGSAAEQIVEEAVKSHADLLVIGAQPRSLLGTVLFGSTTELVIRSAACPVLSVNGEK